MGKRSIEKQVHHTAKSSPHNPTKQRIPISDSGTIPPDDHTSYSTFLVTFPAAKCQEVYKANPECEWILVKDDCVTIDKHKLLSKFVSALRALNEATPSQYRWDFSKMAFACYVEQPVSLAEIEASMNQDNDTMVHAHIVAT